MQPFKKRLRLLVEELQGTLSYDHAGSIEVCFAGRSAIFAPLARDAMTCTVRLDDDHWTFTIHKAYVFDITDRLAYSRFATTLREYSVRSILQLDDYISGEYGARFLESLRREIANDPLIVQRDLGGNRILAEYYYGVLILRDDLAMDGTNVIDFPP